MGAQSLSHVQLFVTPWTVACQAPLSMGFPRQEYQSGLPFPSPGDLPEPASPALASEFFTTGPPGKATNTGSCPKLNPTFESACKASWE